MCVYTVCIVQLTKLYMMVSSSSSCVPHTLFNLGVCRRLLYCFIICSIVCLYVGLAIECKVKLFKYIQIFSENTNFSSRALLASVQCLPNTLAIFPHSVFYAMKCSIICAMDVCYTCSQKEYFFQRIHAFGKCWNRMVDTMNE